MPVGVVLAYGNLLRRGLRAAGLCKMHYGRAWYKGAHLEHRRSMVVPGASLDERLRHHGWTVNDDGCWVWNASRNNHGYGQLAVGGTGPLIASRAAYEAWVGPIPPGGVICHHCDNPPCINPEHLFLGDRAANNRDMAEKRRSANGENKSSHRLKDAQVDEIRTHYAAGGITQKELAAKYGVSQQLVSMLVRRTRRRQSTNRY